MTLNNGVGALIGKNKNDKKKNQNSTWTVELQMDDVDSTIEDIFLKIEILPN